MTHTSSSPGSVVWAVQGRDICWMAWCNPVGIGQEWFTEWRFHCQWAFRLLGPKGGPVLVREGGPVPVHMIQPNLQ